MKVKISDRQTEGKITRWLQGEKVEFNKQRVNCNIEDVDMALLRNRGIVYNYIPERVDYGYEYNF